MPAGPVAEHPPAVLTTYLTQQFPTHTHIRWLRAAESPVFGATRWHLL
jgi:hypothetical protein